MLTVLTPCARPAETRTRELMIVSSRSYSHILPHCAKISENARSESLYRVAQNGTIFLYASTSSNINRFSKLFHCQNQEKICYYKLLQIIINYILSLLLISLKCVVTEVVLFSIVAFKTLDISQNNVATHLKCGRIFSGSIITNFLLILTVK